MYELARADAFAAVAVSNESRRGKMSGLSPGEDEPEVRVGLASRDDAGVDGRLEEGVDAGEDEDEGVRGVPAKEERFVMGVEGRRASCFRNATTRSRPPMYVSSSAILRSCEATFAVGSASALCRRAIRDSCSACAARSSETWSTRAFSFLTRWCSKVSEAC